MKSLSEIFKSAHQATKYEFANHGVTHLSYRVVFSRCLKQVWKMQKHYAEIEKKNTEFLASLETKIDESIDILSQLKSCKGLSDLFAACRKISTENLKALAKTFPKSGTQARYNSPIKNIFDAVEEEISDRG